MAMQTSTLRPGLIVSLKTSLRGNVFYTKRDIVADHSIGDGARVAKWETERTVNDADEHAAAVKVRGEAAYCIQRVCAATAFGLLCPEENESKLSAAMAEARAKVDAFNATARITRLSVNMIVGRVARDDVEAMRAISGEVRDLIGAMSEGVASLDAGKVRDAAKRAREVSAMLSDGGRMRVSEAIESARKAATAISKAVKAGEVAAEAIDAGTIERLRVARASFLDLDETGAPVDVDAGPGRALDLAPADSEFGILAAPSRELEV